METVNKIVAGKRVIVIGPGPSSLEHCTKEFVDGFDVVIRLNMSVKTLVEHPEYQDKIGSRTDILFGHNFAFNRVYKALGKKGFEGVKHILVNIGGYKACGWQDEGIPVTQHINPSNYKQECWKRIGGKPTTGLQLIWALAHSQAAEIHITGITFMSTDSDRVTHVTGYTGGPNKKVKAKCYQNCHKMDRELEFFKNYIDDERFTYDLALAQLVEDPTRAKYNYGGKYKKEAEARKANQAPKEVGVSKAPEPVAQREPERESQEEPIEAPAGRSISKRVVNSIIRRRRRMRSD